MSINTKLKIKWRIKGEAIFKFKNAVIIVYSIAMEIMNKAFNLKKNKTTYAILSSNWCKKSFLIFLFISLGFQAQKEPEYNPMFFDMKKEWLEITKDSILFSFKSKDTLIYHNLRLLSNKENNPRLFYADIKTPVCADGECKLANIKIYWNLVGNYVGYEIYEKNPLTKNEHDPFVKKDYKKLHKLLSDPHSILKLKKITDLVDETPLALNSLNALRGIDAVSGATKKEIKESVVKGGLYSCYTLWHLVHGDVYTKMNGFLKSIHSESLNKYFLYSPYKEYQKYALKKLTAIEFNHHTEQVLNIFKNSSPLTKGYILKKFPNKLLENPLVIKQLYNSFSKLDINTKTILIDKLKKSHSSAFKIVSEELTTLTKNQLKNYFNNLRQKPNLIKSRIKSNIVKTSSSKKYPYNYMAKKFLNQLETR